MAKKILVLALCFSVLFSLTAVVRVGAENTVTSVELHVSTDGSDVTGNGTINAPFASIGRARDVIKSYDRLPDGGVTVYIHGGEYKLSTTVAFDSSNSGEEGAPITYKNYNGEDVSFVGSTHLDGKAIKKVTDEALLDRLIVKEAKDNLYMIDLNTQGITIPTLGESRTSRFFVNGVSLYFSRWPNNDNSGAQYFTGGQPASLSEDEKEAYNGKNQPVIMQYVDTEGRSENWDTENINGNAYLSGGIAYLWYQGRCLIDTINTTEKIVKTTGTHAYSQSTDTPANDRYLYFEHIFEEIDLPAEYFIDRKTGILYFYGVGDMSNPTIEYAQLSKTMLKLDGVSYVTFDGINFRETKAGAIEMTDGCRNVTIKNAVINGIGGNAIIVKGSNIRVEGCNIYDVRDIAVMLYGGDRATLASSGNVFTNNKIHAGSGLSDAMKVEGVGHVISHNDIYDYNIDAANFSWTSNLVIEYNRFVNIGKLTSDAGALYWGRRVTELGNVVRYNYFYDIGSGLSTSGVSAIFCDDGEVCPEIYGNIFYRAGKESGGGAGNVPVRLNGAMYLNFHDNLIVDMYGVLNAISWAVSDNYTGVENLNIPARWWMYSVGLSVNGSSYSSNFTEEQQALMFSNTWKNAYKDTWWSSVYNYINKDLYDAGKAVSDTGVAANMTAWLKENLPEGITNLAKDNVLIGGTEILPVVLNNNGYNRNSNAVSENNIQLDLTNSIFQDIEGKNLSLTENGLTNIQASIPDFEAPDFDNMGILTKNGNAPVSSNAKITGVPTKGNSLIASYDYADADGDAEGVSKIYWYMSDEEDGEYTRLTDGYGKYLSLNDKHEEKYIRYEVVPYDTTYEYGEAVTSEPIFIADVASFDLSATVDTVLSVGGKTKIIPTCKDTEKNIIQDTPAVGWTYENEDPSVISIDDNGQVTALKEGVSVVAVNYGELSKSIVFVVGNTLTSYGFEDNDAQQFAEITNQAEIVADGEKRTGAKALELNPVSGNTDIEAEISADATTLTWWFYDSGDIVGRFYAYNNAGNPKNDVTVGVGHRTSSDSCKDSYCIHGSLNTNLNKNLPDRSEGWHQVVINSYHSVVEGDTYLHTTVYMDGEKMAYTSDAGVKVTSATTHFFKKMYFYAATSTDGLTADAVLYMDDYASVDTTVKHDVTDVTVNFTEGSVAVNGENVISGTPVSVAEGEDVALEVTPAQGREIDKIMIGEEEYTGSFNDIVIPQVTADIVVNITFCDEVLYSGIDLSADLTVIGVDGETTIKVNGIMADDTIDYGRDINKTATFTSGNTDVATVDNIGNVTAVAMGVAPITVNYGEYSKGIVIMVGEQIGDTIDFEDDCTWTDSTDSSVKTASKGRNGTTGLKLPTYTSSTTAVSLADLKDTKAGTVEFWFYDDGADLISGNFAFNGTTAGSKARNLFNFGVGRKADTQSQYEIYNELYSNNGGIKKVSRLQGWHQVVVDSKLYGKDGSVQFKHQLYIDGSLVGDIDRKAVEILGDIFTTLKWNAAGTTGNVSSEIYLDDLSFADTNSIPSVQVSYDGLNNVTQSNVTKGYVTAGDIYVRSSTGWVPADADGNVTLTAVAKEGYEVDSFKINGIAYAIDSNNCISFKANDGDEVDVQFREVVTTPSISGNADEYIFPGTYTHEGEEHNSFVAYYKMFIPFGSTIERYGMRVNGLDAAGLGKAADDVFGIRVFGEAVEENNTYKLEGYVTVEGKEYTTDVIEHVYVK